jgi:nicotinate-nucleotide adenylyltransferase
MMKERIGVFGGTFNPIHEGHLKAAQAAQKVFLLKKVLFIPSYVPPHKGSSEIASPYHRLKMVELAVSPYPQFVASPVEIEAKGTSYSIRTLSRIKQVYPDSWVFFILGVDAFLEIETWKDYERLLEQCHFIVISRPGYRLKDAKDILGGRYARKMLELSGEDKVPEKHVRRFTIFLMSFPALDTASHELRQKIRNRESIAGQVAGPVEKYINQHNLYQ